jgi:GNAT superfamily N-acetyltransferase
MNILIRKAVKADVPAMLNLVKELAAFEKAPNEVTNTIERMEQDGFGDHPVFFAHVAEVNGKVVGMALYYIAYSTWKGKYIYLDDLIVNEQYRRNSIGKKLFDALATLAKEVHANQLRWHVLDWNQPAMDFYGKLNAHFDNEWITCKLSKEQIDNY